MKMPDPDLAWPIKGSHQLSPTGLAVLRELWHWREAEATAANKPPYFVLRHETMVEIAAAAAFGKKIEPLLPQRFSDRRRTTLLHVIKRGLAVPPEHQPGPVRHEFRRMSLSDKRRVTELEKRRNAGAAELGVDPTIIASRATLIDLAVDWDAHQGELMNWQRELMK
jgi:ribonuclease D